METKIKTNKAVLYCRVSSKEQEDTGYSLPAQEKLLKDYADRKLFSVTKVFSVAESASGAKQRKVFNEMMDYMRKNKISHLLCEKVDRITRNLKEAVAVNDWLEEDDGRNIHFVKQNLVIHDNAKSDEKFRWDIEIVLAKKFIANLSEEVKKGQVEKLAQGWLPTKPPLGYKTIGEQGHKIHIVNEDVAHYLRLMFEWYATGNYSLARLEKELYEAGLRSRSGKKLGISRIHILLQDPFYWGKMRWLGEIYPGKHEPLISKDAFDKVQILIRRKTKAPHLAKHNPLFKSKIFCVNCGGMLTWYFKKGHWYGHCNNHGLYRKCSKKTCVRQDRIEEQYIELLDVIAPKNEALLAEIENIIKEEHSENIVKREKEVQRINGLLFSIRQQKDKYFEAKINKEVPADYCERKIAECTQEEEAFELALIKLANNNDEEMQLKIAVHELAYKSKEIYDKALVDEKRLLLSQLFTNITQNEYKIEPKLAPAIEFLEKWMPVLNKRTTENYELATLGTKEPFLGGSDATLKTLLPG